MKPVAAIALSGGVDSLVAAFLLKEQGYRLLGLHFITGIEHPSDFTISSLLPGGPGQAHRNDHPIKGLEKQLNIEIQVVDCRDQFHADVVNYFCETYEKGQTPNPCLVCNQKIKFGYLLKVAKEMGADFLATGHYARVLRDSQNQYRLLKGMDEKKDQSYFLSFLNQFQLSQALFPLGDKTKTSIREYARLNGLVPIDANESQDICFIKNQTYGEFLARWGKFEFKSGPIVDMSGSTIGEHRGLHLFTIGQRKGINCPAAMPYYVVRIDPSKNRLIVGTKADLTADGCNVRDINWIRRPERIEFEARVRLRYRHRETPAQVVIGENNSADVRFHSSQSAVTPGQAAVFYDGEEVLGGGWIEC
jgi:tRNA-uridine 2-sulfurtransferase